MTGDRALAPGAVKAGERREGPFSTDGISLPTVSGFALSMCLAGAFFLTLSPILKSMASELTARPYTFGYPGGAYSVGLGVSAFLCSSFQDTVQRRRLMVAGMALHVAGALLVASAGGWLMVILGYASCGIGVGVFQPAVYGHVVAVAPEASRARLIGFVNLGWAGSTLVGVPAAAWVSERLGWRAVGLLTVAAWALIAVFIARFLNRPEPVGGPAEGPHWSLRVLRELHASRFTWLVLITVLVFIGFYGVYSFFGVAIIEKQGLTQTGVGFFVFWYGLGFLLGSLTAKSIDRIGDRRALLIAALGLGTILLTLPLTFGSRPWLAGSMVLWGTFQATAFTSITSIAGTICPKHRGRSLSLKSSAVMVGASLGTVSMGFVNARFGYEVVTTLCGVTTLTAALLAARKLTPVSVSPGGREPRASGRFRPRTGR